MNPTTENEVAQIIKDTSTPLNIIGGGTRMGAKTGTILSTAAMSGITVYEPGALTLVAKSGTPVAEIEAALQSQNQRLAFEPMDHRALLGTSGTPTIGGIVAANVSGPRRISAGACRDFMLGVRFIDGNGTLIKNGGRVMKNVTGYDLVKLLTGSFGTLGVLTEISLKTLPKTDATATVIIDDLDDAQAIQAMSMTLCSPYDVTGAAHDPTTRKTMIRVEGFADSVAYRAEKINEILGPIGKTTTTDDTQIWCAVRDVTTFSTRPGDVWRLSVKPSDAAMLTAKLHTRGLLYDWSGGLIWALTDPGYDLRNALGAFNGHATLIRGQNAPNFHPEPTPLAAITAGIRAKFDPRGILNPGLM